MNDLQQQADQLRAQAAALDAQIAQQKLAARAGVVAGLKATIAEHGITGAELGFKGGKDARASKPAGDRSHPSAGKKVPAKFKDANGNSWTGRGVKPRWLSAAIAAGATLQSFAV